MHHRPSFLVAQALLFHNVCYCQCHPGGYACCCTHLGWGREGEASCGEGTLCCIDRRTAIAASASHLSKRSLAFSRSPSCTPVCRMVQKIHCLDHFQTHNESFSRISDRQLPLYLYTKCSTAKVQRLQPCQNVSRFICHWTGAYTLLSWKRQVVILMP